MRLKNILKICIFLSLSLSACASAPEVFWLPHVYSFSDGNLFGDDNQLLTPQEAQEKGLICFTKPDYEYLYSSCVKTQDETPWYKFWE